MTIKVSNVDYTYIYLKKTQNTDFILNTKFNTL